MRFGKIFPDMQGYIKLVIMGVLNHYHVLFIEKILSPEIDHKDGNRKNNKVENLRWVTRKENANNPISKLRYLMQSVRQIKDGKVIAEYESMREAERKTKIAHSSIKKR